MSLTVYGASDDLIEIEGDIDEEFSYKDDDASQGDLIATSNGVVLRVEYGQAGVWRIRPVVGAEKVEIILAPEDDESNYSDRAVISGDVRWVVQGVALAKVRAHA